MRACSPALTVALLLLLSGCSFNQRYVAGRRDLDPKTREAILQHRVILGMFPDEAIAAAGTFASAVKADKARWGEKYDSWQVIRSERAHPDDSYIDLVFWTRTQFDTPERVGFKVVFSHGRAVSITRLPPPKEDDARLTRAVATRIAEAAAEKHGYHLADYRKAKAYYEALGKEKTWSAFFESKAPIPDNHFTVWIDDRTGEAQVETWKR